MNENVFNSKHNFLRFNFINEFFEYFILFNFNLLIFKKGKTMYLMASTGWALSTWLLNILWENAQVILHQYKEYVLWYLMITSLISFIICYRIGPVTNTRTKNIIQWALQVKFNSIFIYF